MKVSRNKFFLTAIEVIVGLSAYGYLAYMIYKNWEIGQRLQISNWRFFLLIILLMPVNLLFEAQKWRYLVRNIEAISLSRAYLSVLRGMPYGVITPARVGEWFGRSRYMMNKGQVVIMGGVGGYVQQMVTVIMGAVGLLLFFRGGNKWLFAFVISFIGLVLGYVMMKILSGYSRRFKFMDISLGQYLTVLFYALFRYGIFSSQYVLSLKLFGVEASLVVLFSSVFVIYLMTNLAPLNSLVDLGVRGTVASFLLSAYGSVLGITVAGFVVWAVNVLLPSLIGGGILIYSGIWQKNL